MKRIPKYAIAGTSCAGKTTLTYAIVSRMKQYGILVDGVLNSDRRITFDPDLLNTREKTQVWMVNNIMQKEIELEMQPDVDVIVSDRSVLDLMAYYTYQYPTSRMRYALQGVVDQWMATYDRVFVLDPLAYQGDNKRPPDEFRMGVDKTLRETIQQKAYPNVVVIDRTQVLNTILKDIGFTKPKAKITITPEEVQNVANAMNLRMAVSSFDVKDAASDYDLFIESFPSETTRQMVVAMLGAHVPLDILFVPSLANQMGFQVFTPVHHNDRTEHF